MNNTTTTIDTVCEVPEGAFAKPVLQQIARIQVAEMNRHSKGSPEYNLARLEWSKAQAALCKIDGDTNMQRAYEREVRYYERLVETQESAR